MRRRDAEDEQERRDNDFRSLVFATAIAPENEEALKNVFEDQGYNEGDIEWQFPRTPEEQRELLESVRGYFPQQN